MSSISESNMAGSEVKDEFVSLLSSKHVCPFFLPVHSTRSSYILDSNFLRVAVFYQNVKSKLIQSILQRASACHG